MIKKRSIRQRSLTGIASFIIYLIIGFSLVLFLGQASHLQAQTLRPESVATQVYQLLPDLPKENQYVNQETGTIDEDNTLISRFVSYHEYTKRRPTGFRLDWKLTFADYLGVNENISADSYPGYSTLTINPLAGDLQAIESFNLRQRNQLVAVLINIYKPQPENTPPPETTPEPTPEPSLKLPQPGDAELLKP